jgi:hypothetical protein
MLCKGWSFMGKKKKGGAPNTSQTVTPLYRNNLTKRNKALLYVLGGFAILLYLISFVRMGQW